MTIKNLQVVIEVVEVCLIFYLSDKWLKINQLAPIITLKKETVDILQLCLCCREKQEQIQEHF